MNSASVQPAVRVVGLTKSFGGRLVLKNLSLELERGRSLAILGHNGSGKTTLIRILAGLTRPTAGRVELDGVTPGPNAGFARRAIGVVSHNTFLYPNLTPIENLRFYGRLFGVRDLEARIEASLAQLGLRVYAGSPVRTLSRGTQQRVAIARALLHNPPIVLLDEPDTGLDPQGMHMLPEWLTAAGLAQRTVILTTHNLELGLTMAQEVAILAGGQLMWRQPTEVLSLSALREAYFANLPESLRVRVNT